MSEQYETGQIGALIYMSYTNDNTILAANKLKMMSVVLFIE